MGKVRELTKTVLTQRYPDLSLGVIEWHIQIQSLLRAQLFNVFNYINYIILNFLLR